jgi:6,7-dimethyl-8-ribityllumazine synthase
MSQQMDLNDRVGFPALPDGVRQVVGEQKGGQVRCAIVVSRFNQDLTSQLAGSAVDALLSRGVAERDILVVWVPGAYEIPAVAAELIRREDIHAVIALGVVIQGQTQHAQLINEHIAQSLGRLALRHAKPVIYEVISALDIEHARARSAAGRESRGWYAGLAALETRHVFQQLRDLP